MICSIVVIRKYIIGSIVLYSHKISCLHSHINSLKVESGVHAAVFIYMYYGIIIFGEGRKIIQLCISEPTTSDYYVSFKAHTDGIFAEIYPFPVDQGHRSQSRFPART